MYWDEQELSGSSNYKNNLMLFLLPGYDCLLSLYLLNRVLNSRGSLLGAISSAVSVLVSALNGV